MPTWGEILGELQTSNPDAIRRKYLTQLVQHTDRDVSYIPQSGQIPATFHQTL